MENGPHHTVHFFFFFAKCTSVTLGALVYLDKVQNSFGRTKKNSIYNSEVSGYGEKREKLVSEYPQGLAGAER